MWLCSVQVSTPCSTALFSSLVHAMRQGLISLRSFAVVEGQEQRRRKLSKGRGVFRQQSKLITSETNSQCDKCIANSVVPKWGGGGAMPPFQ